MMFEKKEGGKDCAALCGGLVVFADFPSGMAYLAKIGAGPVPAAPAAPPKRLNK